MSRLPRVIIAEATTRFSLEKAQNHGTIVALSHTTLNPFTVDGAVGIFNRRLDDINFDPSIDFVCLTGGSLIVGLFMAVIGAKYKGKPVKLLMYHAETSDYRIRMMEV